MDSLLSELSQLVERMQIAVAPADNLRDELRDLEAKNIELSIAVADAAQTIEEKNEEIKSMAKTIADLQAKVGTLENRLRSVPAPIPFPSAAAHQGGPNLSHDLSQGDLAAKYVTAPHTGDVASYSGVSFPVRKWGAPHDPTFCHRCTRCGYYIAASRLKDIGKFTWSHMAEHDRKWA